jgi:hypothetical protein
MPKAADPLAGLSPLVRRIVSLVGRRAEDADVISFVTETLGQKVPGPTTDAGGTKNVVAKKHGVELAFDHDIKNDKYALVRKTAKSFVPYLSLAWLTPRFKELPYGIVFGMEPDEVTKRFGVEPEKRSSGLAWSRVLDAERDIKLDYDGSECRIVVDEALELSGRHGVPAKPVVGVFVAWAAQRGLFDATRAGSHAALLEDVRAGKRKGSELLDAAWPRGLWSVHLVDKPGLRQFAHSWFHNIGGVFINQDLIAVFGERTDQHGHPAPVLDDDDPAAVKKATPKLDAVFTPWLD